MTEAWIRRKLKRERRMKTTKWGSKTVKCTRNHRISERLRERLTSVHAGRGSDYWWETGVITQSQKSTTNWVGVVWWTDFWEDIPRLTDLWPIDLSPTWTWTAWIRFGKWVKANITRCHILVSNPVTLLLEEIPEEGVGIFVRRSLHPESEEEVLSVGLWQRACVWMHVHLRQWLAGRRPGPPRPTWLLTGVVAMTTGGWEKLRWNHH